MKLGVDVAAEVGYAVVDAAAFPASLAVPLSASFPASLPASEVIAVYLAAASVVVVVHGLILMSSGEAFSLICFTRL